ncbi:MAG: beta-ketoacyl-ACP synthase II [Halobacteriovoraceae bacterium]|nr:beta-ketoacyl-ACP synthase II [Halobacteriovoraceae bacterium]MCB9094178.1 beta-ketoacyl-ACP synthase II [Halobacteriovoraceae bacterium]
MSNNKRIVITGLGAISGLGTNVDQIWSELIQGRSGVRKLSERFQDKVPFDFPVNIASYVDDNYQLSDSILSEREQPRFDKFIHYALQVTHDALKDASLEVGTTYDKSRIGCILGVGMGGFPFIEHEYFKFSRGTRPRTTPFFIPSLIPNMATGLASICFGFTGVNFSVSSACASSGHAIEMGYQQLKLGLQDAVIVGGSEAVITKLTISGFNSMKALSKREVEPNLASCPFSSDRDGFVMGEGAGVLVLEEYEKAKARGAKIYAEIVGCGSSSDAFHITAPHQDGLGAVQCMNNALENANLAADKIGYINAHGTSTPIGDAIETKAIKTVFGSHAHELSVSSTKSMTGHLLGAASGLESVITVLSLKNQIIPPTINLKNPDPDCDLDYTPNQAREKSFDYALNNAFGFGGTNSSIIFKKYEG